MRFVLYGHLKPEPEVGWRIRRMNGPNTIYIVGPCLCYPEPTKAWPDANLCGAHLFEERSGGALHDTDERCYTGHGGWCDAFELISTQADSSPFENATCIGMGVGPASSGLLEFAGMPSKVEGLKTCPVCGSPGFDLVFSFECSNESCPNARH